MNKRSERHRKNKPLRLLCWKQFLQTCRYSEYFARLQRIVMEGNMRISKLRIEDFLQLTIPLISRLEG